MCPFMCPAGTTFSPYVPLHVTRRDQVFSLCGPSFAPPGPSFLLMCPLFMCTSSCAPLVICPSSRALLFMCLPHYIREQQRCSGIIRSVLPEELFSFQGMPLADLLDFPMKHRDEAFEGELPLPRESADKFPEEAHYTAIGSQDFSETRGRSKEPGKSDENNAPQ